ARIVVVGSVAGALARSRHPVPRRWVGVLTWGGVRGALAMVLALSLSPDFPGREEVVTVTFGVVLLSILVQGVTMRPLLRRLGLIGAPSS
ncbi:MAG: cation:proton antiporter, partial [Gemmatimonadales bacterium]